MSNRPADDCRQDIEEAKNRRPGFAGVGSRDLEFEEVETGEALHRGAAGDRVVTGAFARCRAARALGHVLRLRRNIEKFSWSGSCALNTHWLAVRSRWCGCGRGEGSDSSSSSCQIGAIYGFRGPGQTMRTSNPARRRRAPTF
jgi:hypothetical protein